jgi:hypothetical protein
MCDRTKQTIQKQIAAGAISRPVDWHAVIQDKMAFQSCLRRGGGGLPDVVRLQSALRNNRRGTRVQRFADQKLQLARLISTQREPRAIVALDIKTRPAQKIAQSLKRFKRRRRMN